MKKSSIKYVAATSELKVQVNAMLRTRRDNIKARIKAMMDLNVSWSN